MRKITYGGSISFDVFGTIEVPDGVDPQEYAHTPGAKLAMLNAMAAFWRDTNNKFEDGVVVAIDWAVADDSGNPGTEFDEVVELF